LARTDSLLGEWGTHVPHAAVQFAATFSTQDVSRRTRADRPNFPRHRQTVCGQRHAGSAFLDPHIGGSYSVWTVGQLTAFGGVEGRPEGPIHFAGEHTSLEQQGFMEGGASTGLRAAHEVLAAVQRQVRT